MVSYGHGTPKSGASVDVSVSNLDIEALVASLEDDPELQNNLRAASVVIVPTDLGREHEGPVFPNTTREVYQRLREELDEGTIVEAAIRDENYEEFLLHSDDVILPVLFITREIIVSGVVNILASYIYDRLRNRGEQSGESTVKCKIHSKRRNENPLLIEYDGPAENFGPSLLQILRELGIAQEDYEAAE